ncbi:ATP-binding protein [Youngiibacter fragilis]|uniref:ATPase n=1 Tax=Youngiibacter fragilis 232.1 TaxID=994573 RepID=V7I7G3_9CLOT|nr:ATP-binding protein [Youngiibacter fragilis]ETA81169.1 ATPase [Youngiibacter fragilis 232.1]
MKQLLILSGKGGTGKTTVAAAFIRLLDARSYADCDVDAPNLHLVTRHESPPEMRPFFGMPKAFIDRGKCADCGICMEYCRFGAISDVNGHEVEPYACEGCGVCMLVCPYGAVELRDSVSGDLMLYRGKDIFSTAELRMGSGNSGLLVTEVKRQLKDEAVSEGIAIIDGSPGIGCPVIASITGVDMVLIVTEPSLSGMSDLKRIVASARQFRTKVAVCINKADTEQDIALSIESWCRSEGIPLAGRIPFDKKALEAVNRNLSIADIDCPSGNAARKVFEETMSLLMNEGDESEYDRKGTDGQRISFR